MVFDDLNAPHNAKSHLGKVAFKLMSPHGPERIRGKSSFFDAGQLADAGQIPGPARGELFEGIAVDDGFG